MSPLTRPAPKPPMQKKKPRKYLPRVNRQRAAFRRARDFGSLADWIVTLPCCVTGLRAGQWFTLNGERTQAVIDPAHVKSRGSGGQAKANLVPLSRHLHDDLHRMGPSWFAARYRVTLDELRAMAVEYQRLHARLFEQTERAG